MSPKRDAQKPPSSTTATDNTSAGFTDEERTAMKERAKELKSDSRANKNKADGESDSSPAPTSHRQNRLTSSVPTLHRPAFVAARLRRGGQSRMTASVPTTCLALGQSVVSSDLTPSLRRRLARHVCDEDSSGSAARFALTALE